MLHSVLLVEDDAEIREMTRFSLTRAGFDVREAESAEDALSKLDGVLPSIVIIDWMLPAMSGVELARRLRNDDHTRELPLLMLTARGEEADKLKGFDSGIDDYVVKPFSPKELAARVRALLRRSGAPEEGVVEAGGLRLELKSHRLIISDAPVHIGPTEFRLLAFLMGNPERAFDRAALLDRVWGRNVYVEERTVDVHVLRLRKILKEYGLDNLIQTVRGVGYRFSAKTNAPAPG